MFGYIVVNQPELKFREFDRYHAYYCGVCRDLKAGFGISGQVTLSYDLTFLAMLLTGLYEPDEIKETTRCIVHPTKRHTMIRNEWTAYAAAMNVLLAYHNARDDRLDDKMIRGAVMSGFLNKSYRKSASMYPDKAKLIAKCLNRIHTLEKKDSGDLDLVSGLFGRIMASLFVPEKDVWSEKLWRLGFFLGKYIYLLDAYDDVEEDIKRNNYNPLKNKWNTDRESFDGYCEDILRMMIAESTRAFEALPVLRDADILRNILYGGVWVRFAAAKEKRSVGSV